jgi:homoaconitase/3-isopropylmalate dehydratase large subunit
LAPQVAAPHSPANTHAVSEFQNVAVQVAYIGACTGAKLDDLRAAAQVFKGKRIAQGVRLMVAPASLTDQSQAEQEGVMSVLRDVLMLQVGAGVELVNQRHIVAIEDRAVKTTSSLTLSALDAVNQARARMSNNSPPLLVLESLLIQASGRIHAVSS